MVMIPNLLLTGHWVTFSGKPTEIYCVSPGIIQKQVSPFFKLGLASVSADTSGVLAYFTVTEHMGQTPIILFQY